MTSLLFFFVNLFRFLSIVGQTVDVIFSSRNIWVNVTANVILNCYSWLDQFFLHFVDLFFLFCSKKNFSKFKSHICFWLRKKAQKMKCMRKCDIWNRPYLWLQWTDRDMREQGARKYINRINYIFRHRHTATQQPFQSATKIIYTLWKLTETFFKKKMWMAPKYI